MEVKIRSDISEINSAAKDIIPSWESLGLKEEIIFRLRLALEEAIVNAIRHGNKFNAEAAVTINFSCDKNKIILSVEDEGAGFDYNSLADPTQEDNLLKTSGRGIFLIRSIMDRVEFNEKGNKITMTKFF